MLAGLGVGLYSDPAAAAQMIDIEKSFMVRMGDGERVSRQRLWQDAVRRARTPADRHDAGA
jgi:glycerol kinase